MSEPIEAGRETDAMIAEKLFGATWFEPPGVSDDGWQWLIRSGWAYSTGEPALATRAGGETKLAYAHGLPHYSTDRTAALEVVDRLTEADMQVTISANNWLVSVHVENIAGELLAHANCGFDEPAEIALCICRATLDPRVLAALRAASGSETP